MPPPSIEPGVLLARVQAERHRAEQRQGRILAELVVGRGVAASRRCRSCTASAACSAGTISPAAKTWIWNLLSVASRDVLGEQSRPRRKACRAISGSSTSAAISPPASIARWPALRPRIAARPSPAAFRNSRRFMAVSSLVACRAGAAPSHARCSDRSRPTSVRYFSGQTPVPCKSKTPEAWPPGLRQIGRLPRQVAGAGADHEGVEAVFGDLPPQILVAAEGDAWRRRPS